MEKKVLITGGSGFIGKKLTDLLQRNGYSVSILTRMGGNFGNVNTYKWDPQKGMIDDEALEDLFAIIHLAGAGVVNKKWTRQRKQLILESRTKSAQLLFQKLKEKPYPERPEVFISASGVGYYGYDTGSILVKETSRPGDDFLATVCKEWELAAEAFEDLNMRVVKFRIGFVLSEIGGALKVMLKPVRFWLGAGLGRGDQYLSWIHIEDLVRMFLLALDNTSLNGPYNAVGPSPLTNKSMMQTIAKVLDKPFFLPNVPVFALKLIMGEMASMVTGGNKVSAEKIISEGFDFHYSDLEEALENLIKK